VLIQYDQDLEHHLGTGAGRQIPYGHALHDPAGAHYDFIAQPELIPRVLEDFLPFGDEPGVQRFYDLLRWVNGPTSPFESTDCGMRPPSLNPTPDLGEGATVQIFGRVMIVFRNHRRNVDQNLVRMFMTQLAFTLKNIDRGWKRGCIMYAPTDSHFTTLGTEPSADTIGLEVCLNWWAWGDSDDRAFDSLGRLSDNLRTALEAVAVEVPTWRVGLAKE